LVRTIADDDVVPEEKKKREYKEMEHKSAGDQHAKVAMDTVSFLWEGGGEPFCRRLRLDFLAHFRLTPSFFVP